MLTYFASLGVMLNGILLQCQSGVTVSDTCNKPCRITVESAIPEDGPEAVAPEVAELRRTQLQRIRVGDEVHLDVVLYTRGRPNSLHPVASIDGKIVSCEYSQPLDGKQVAMQRFTVEATLRKPEG